MKLAVKGQQWALSAEATKEKRKELKREAKKSLKSIFTFTDRYTLTTTVVAVTNKSAAKQKARAAIEFLTGSTEDRRTLQEQTRRRKVKLKAKAKKKSKEKGKAAAAKAKQATPPKMKQSDIR